MASQWRACALLAVVLLGTASASTTQVTGRAPDLGVRDAALARLFTPLSAPPGAYEVFRSPRPIAELAAELRARDPEPLEDAWEVRRLAPVDAFGSDGFHDGPRLARLYVGTLPLVARGSLRTPEGLLGYTLIAPWPDATLSSLQPGTMVIVVHVDVLISGR